MKYLIFYLYWIWFFQLDYHEPSFWLNHQQDPHWWVVELIILHFILWLCFTRTQKMQVFYLNKSTTLPLNFNCPILQFFWLLGGFLWARINELNFWIGQLLDLTTWIDITLSFQYHQMFRLICKWVPKYYKIGLYE